MGKNKITLIAGVEAYDNLSTFTNVKQLNEAVRSHKEKHADLLSETMLRILDVLHRHSAKYTGVSFLAKSNIGKLIGKCRRTIIRVCQRLEDLGIIRQYETKRASDMQQSSNAIVILPPVVAVTQEEPPMSRQENKPSLKQPLHNKKNVESADSAASAEYTSNRVPASFRDLVACFYNKADIIEEYWRMTTLQTRYIDHSPDTIAQLACDAFRQTVRKVKGGRVRKAIAYYYGVVNRKLDELFYADMAEMGGLPALM
ncbi:helix-turn-helix domain-containing protein [Metabacillus sp. RGM 3146]|uniref:helix-turn-helix domain-containing protein n=1 Tax=Metabacillus sp. RGM 3146 TaxID=3401092 RepID=UPI003B9DAF01